MENNLDVFQIIKDTLKQKDITIDTTTENMLRDFITCAQNNNIVFEMKDNTLSLKKVENKEQLHSFDDYLSLGYLSSENCHLHMIVQSVINRSINLLQHKRDTENSNQLLTIDLIKQTIPYAIKDADTAYQDFENYHSRPTLTRTNINDILYDVRKRGEYTNEQENKLISVLTKLNLDTIKIDDLAIMKNIANATLPVVIQDIPLFEDKYTTDNICDDLKVILSEETPLVDIEDKIDSLKSLYQENNSGLTRFLVQQNLSFEDLVSVASSNLQSELLENLNGSIENAVGFVNMSYLVNMTFEEVITLNVLREIHHLNTLENQLNIQTPTQFNDLLDADIMNNGIRVTYALSGVHDMFQPPVNPKDCSYLVSGNGFQVKCHDTVIPYDSIVAHSANHIRFMLPTTFQNEVEVAGYPITQTIKHIKPKDYGKIEWNVKVPEIALTNQISNVFIKDFNQNQIENVLDDNKVAKKKSMGLGM